MSDIVKALMKRSSVFIIIIGVILLLVGASSEIAFGTFALRLSDKVTQWVMISISIVLILFGIYWEIKGNAFLGDALESFGLFTSDTDTFSRLKVENQIANAKTIELVGYNLKSFLQEYREQLAKAVVKGATVRIILTNLMDHSTQEILAQHSNHPQRMLPAWVAALESIQEMQAMVAGAPKNNGNLIVKFTTWFPSCNLIIFNSGSDTAMAKVGIHTVTFRQTLAGRVSLILSKKDNAKAIDYFIKGFDILWEKDSVEWDNRIPTIGHVLEPLKAG
jgi:hypothetical protein